LEDSDSKRRLAAEIAKLTRPTLPARKAPLIHAFEFTHEPAWNTLKDFIESRGAIDLYGSRDASREAFAKGLITKTARRDEAGIEALDWQSLFQTEMSAGGGN